MGILTPILGGWHLPLNPLDQINQPPLEFLQVQDGLLLTVGVLWTTSYILSCRDAFRDRSYGIPLLTLWFNLGWEFVYGFCFPSSLGDLLVNFPWLFCQLTIAYATISHGPAEWKHKPLIANNLALWLFGCLPFSICFHWAFIKSFPLRKDSILISAVMTQMGTSIGGLAHIILKGSTGGHSLGAWFFRTLGTGLIVTMHVWQWYNYPQDHPIMSLPITLYCVFLFEGADLIYPFAFTFISKYEKQQTLEKRHGDRKRLR
ncbi:hypothetical protein S40288_09016 [Stachybotrys chartarum IBT 40288]|nr:hypothetical protein S40288_09016 [Stachybotrys chartarum IBT 40288]